MVARDGFPRTQKFTTKNYKLGILCCFDKKMPFLKKIQNGGDISDVSEVFFCISAAINPVPLNGISYPARFWKGPLKCCQTVPIFCY
jgi:hypothetical protein